MAHNGTEHGLEVEGRADRLTDLTQRSKLAHRLCELPCPCLQFLEQPNVFDRDYSLVGEVREEGNLFVSARSDFRAANRNGPDSFIFPQQGCNQHSANPTNLLLVLRFRELCFKLCRNITNVNRLAVDDGSADG